MDEQAEDVERGFGKGQRDAVLALARDRLRETCETHVVCIQTGREEAQAMGFALDGLVADEFIVTLGSGVPLRVDAGTDGVMLIVDKGSELTLYGQIWLIVTVVDSVLAGASISTGWSCLPLADAVGDEDRSGERTDPTVDD